MYPLALSFWSIILEYVFDKIDTLVLYMQASEFIFLNVILYLASLVSQILFNILMTV